MFFDKTYINNLKSRVSVVDVVSKYVPLKTKGKEEFKGLCPFHNEKTPSFSVSDSRGFYHCFGCGAHGDAIKFLMDHKGYSYPEAIKELALDAGMELPKYSEQDKIKHKKIEDSYEILELATKWFQENLQNSNAIQARKYLKERGLSDETIKKFRLGFAPDNKDGLKKYLNNFGVENAILIENGLIGESEDKSQTYDRFRGRIIFPIFDSQNKVIAFGGRIIDKNDNVAKYLNSPETELFKKSYVLYGYNFARDKAYKKEQIIIVEGYMDVIAMHQAGFENAVAPLGTAVTEFHLEHMWKICKEPIFCLDGDSAGLRASKKTAENFITKLEPGYSMKFAFMQDGKDPDEIIKNFGVQKMQNIIDNATNLSDFLWNLNLKEANPTTPEKKAEFADKIYKIAKSIENPIVKEFYLNDFKNRVKNLIYGTKAKNVVALQPITKSEENNNLANQVVNGFAEKILFLTSQNPELLYHSSNEEFLTNLKFNNNLLENLLDELIDFRLNFPLEVATNIAFLKHLAEKNSFSTIDYLEKCPLKRDFKHIDNPDKSNSCWEYLIAEYYISLEKIELENHINSNLKGEDFDNKFTKLQQSISKLEQEKNMKLSIYLEKCNLE
ncbi:MAG: DNA primase [Rickettsiales bacterium]|nr:DNA primase [Rickettsiales bacterium]